MYHNVLMYNHQNNASLKDEFDWFKWEPEYDEIEYVKAVETFKYNNNTHQEIRFYCKWFSDKLKTVVSEHLNSLSGHSSIIGYYGPPQ